MPNLPKMFHTEKNDDLSTNRTNRLTHDKRKRLAVLTKPQRWKPVAVNVFFGWRGIYGPRLFCFKTCDEEMQWTQP